MRLSVPRACAPSFRASSSLRWSSSCRICLEPELVDLVDHDEEHLVVLRSLGQGALEREQLVDFQVFGVRRHETVYSRMIVHVLDGTYELFRHFYGLRRFNKGKDKPFGAVAGLLHSVLEMIEKGATHLGVATDHVIESFRNDLWPDYKTGEGIDRALWRAVPSAGGGARRDGRRRVADGRARGRRRAGLRRAHRVGGRARREGLHLGQRQGSGAVRPRRPGGAGGSPGQGDPRRGGRAPRSSAWARS